MAIGPQQQNKVAILEQAERIIDKHLAGSVDGATISTTLLPDGFSCSYWPALESKYLKAGWKRAEWVTDQRDGDYLCFEP